MIIDEISLRNNPDVKESGMNNGIFPSFFRRTALAALCGGWRDTGTRRKGPGVRRPSAAWLKLGADLKAPEDSKTLREVISAV